MNKTSKLLLTLASSLLVGFSVASCGNNPAPASSSASKDAGSIKLNYTNKAMIYGDTLELIAVYSGPETMKWSSSDESIATVKDGTVKAVGEGKCVITVSAGNETATCDVSVSFGDVVPSLNIQGIPSSLEASLSVGSSLALNGEVEFNGGLFDCDLEVEIEDQTVVTYENGALVAKKNGTTKVDVKGIWNNFDNPLMRKTLTIEVSDNISIYAGYIENGTKSVTNRIDLSLVSSWGGKEYKNSATLFGVASEGNVEHSLAFEIEDTSIAYLDGNVVKAKENGVTYAVGTYVSASGQSYSTKIQINISCPVDTYLEEVKYCVGDEFPVEEIFGEGARILSASQDGVELDIRRGKIIKGIEAAGHDTLPVEVLTDKGGYVFSNIFAYTAALDKDNIYDTLALSSGKIITGYYILDDDIDDLVDFTSQSQSSYVKDALTNTYFAGTFDGQGHTINAKVSKNGMFGGFGNGAHVINTHFNFTFDETSSTVAVGLSSNAAVFVQKEWIVTIQNNYFTTTNYLKNSYTLMDFRFNHMVLKDNLVVLSDTSALDPYTSATQQQAALFRVDAVIFQGPYTSYSGEFVNNAVVTGRFMPMANGLWLTDSEGLNQEWVCYAGNDTSYIGDFSRETTDSTQFGYSIISPYGKDAKQDLFGHLGGGWFSGDKLAVLYSSRGDITNGGISRYDTIDDLINKGIESIGDWKVRQ